MANLHLNVLQDVRVASPCTANWNDMVGDDKVRHCTLCGLNVHNLSAMSREEAESLVQSKVADPSRRLCVQFYRRADGTMLTQDCPRGLAAVRAKARRAARRVAAAVGLAAITGFVAAEVQARAAARGQPSAMRQSTAVRWVADRLRPRPVAILGKLAIKGECSFAPSPPPAPTSGNSAAGGASNR